LPVTDRAIVLERGRIVLEERSRILLADPAPLERFLGVAER
jgi:ABC-type branched-subunit amino acid transport system ATPase component